MSFSHGLSEIMNYIKDIIQFESKIASRGGRMQQKDSACYQ